MTPMFSHPSHSSHLSHSLFLLAFPLPLLFAGSLFAAPGDILATFAVEDPGGAGGRTQAPVSAILDEPHFADYLVPGVHLELVELGEDGTAGESVPVQFTQHLGRSERLTLDFLLPEGSRERRPFQLREKNCQPDARMGAEYAIDKERVNIAESGKPVLCYHHGSSPVPEGIGPEFARGDYVSALYGLHGERLTDDYPADHPHHRAVNWSWATIQWKGETRDLFAVRGIWARPVGLGPVTGGTVFAEIQAESNWMWDDTTCVVHEWATIRIYKTTTLGRLVDISIRLMAFEDGVEFCGRLEAGYSGFNVRMAPGEGQRILFHTDPPETTPRRAWADYSAQFPGGSGRSGLAILQSEANPDYPNEWRQYPELNFFQPVYPGGALIPMPKGEAIDLEFRLWIHDGAPEEPTLKDLWTAYNEGPRVLERGGTDAALQKSAEPVSEIVVSEPPQNP